MPPKRAPTGEETTRTPWSLAAEKLLLKLVIAQRGGSRAKGLKSKEWAAISTKIAEKHNIATDGSKCRQKHARLMAQFKVFKSLEGKSGAGYDHSTCRPLLAAEVWADLIQAANDAVTKSYIRGIQKDGFAHAELCSLLAGDSVATGEDGGDIEQVVTSLQSEGAPIEAAANDAGATDVDGSSATGATLESDNIPASHDRRLARVKRLREGRKKAAERARAASTDAASAVDPVAAALIAAAKVTELYFSKRACLLDNEAGQVTP